MADPETIEQRVSTSPIRDEATGLETLCALLHTAGSADPNVIKDVAWRTSNLIRAWREQGAEVERLREGERRQRETAEAATRGWKKDAAEVERLRAELAARCSCDGDPIECNHEAARGQAEADRAWAVEQIDDWDQTDLDAVDILTRLRDRFSGRVSPARAGAAPASDATACELAECERFREWLSGQKADADKRARQAETANQRIRQDVDTAISVTDGMLIQRDNLTTAGYSERAAGIDAIVTEFRAVLHRIGATLDAAEAGRG